MLSVAAFLNSNVSMLSSCAVRCYERPSDISKPWVMFAHM